MQSGEAPPFGELLRRYRKVAGLTQEELAERAHLSVRGISDLERGVRRVPRADTVALLIDALELVESARANLESAARQLGEAVTPPAPRSTSHGTHPAALPLVGRTQERTAMERHLSGEGPPVFLLAGEPGIGKTRLLKEAVEYASRAGLRALTGSCQRHGDRMPYAPLLEALQSYLRKQNAARLRTDLQGCAWLVRLLPELAEGPIEPVPEWLLSPEQERRLMGQAVERFIANVAGPAGTVLVLDDLQWAGSDALALLTTLARTMEGDHLRIVAAYRATEAPTNEAFGAMLADLAQSGLAIQRQLGPLSADESTVMLGQLLSDRNDAGELDAQIRERLLGRAEGVPFFLVSCAQAMREGAIEDGVPWNVAQGVRQRVTALPSAAQEILSVASVAGRTVPRSLLLHVVARPEDDVLVGLEDACRSGLLAERGLHDYEVTHDVIREVVEADLGAARRTALHRQIAVALATMPGEPPVEAVAYHFAQTDEHTQAAHWLEQAGNIAAARFASATAIEQYRAARERAAASGVGEALSRLDEKLADLYTLTGEYAKAREAYAAALAHAGIGASEIDPSVAARRVELLRKEGDAWEKQGEYAHALAAFDEAETESGANGAGPGLPNAVQAAMELSRGVVYQRQGNNDAAEAAANRAVELLGSESPTGAAAAALARAFTLQGHVALHRGDLSQADDLYQRGLRLRERIGDQNGSAGAWNNLGRTAFRRGDLTRAEECFQHALDLHEMIGDQQSSAGCWHNLGAAARDRGDLARAEDCYHHCLTISERIGDLKLNEHSWHSLGIVAHDRGDLAHAEECFERSLAISDRIGDLHTTAHTRHQLGKVARDRGDLGRAEECAQRGLALFEQLGDEHGRADCWTTLGVVAGERGEFTMSAWRCRAANRLARSTGVAETVALATLGQAHARLRAGRLRAASALLDHAHDVATTCALRLETTQVALMRAELELRGIAEGRGTLSVAQSFADDALRAATQGEYRREEALAHRLLAQCAITRSMLAEAREHLQVALAIQTEMGAALEVGRTQLTYAAALAAEAEYANIPQEAYALLARARAAFLAAGAASDLSEAKRMLAEWAREARAPNAV